MYSSYSKVIKALKALGVRRLANIRYPQDLELTHRWRINDNASVSASLSFSVELDMQLEQVIFKWTTAEGYARHCYTMQSIREIPSYQLVTLFMQLIDIMYHSRYTSEMTKSFWRNPELECTEQGFDLTGRESWVDYSQLSEF